MTVAVLWICAAITLGVFGVMLYSVATFDRGSRTHASARSHRPIIEMLWSTIPILIFMSAMLPVLRSLAAWG